MSIFTKSSLKSQDEKWIGLEQKYNQWTPNNCKSPASFSIGTGNLPPTCSQSVSNITNAYNLCFLTGNIPECSGFDFDISTNTMFYRTNYDENALTDRPGWTTGTQQTIPNWGLILFLILFILIVIILAIAVYYVFKKNEILNINSNYIQV